MRRVNYYVQLITNKSEIERSLTMMSIQSSHPDIYQYILMNLFSHKNFAEQFIYEPSTV